LTLSVPDFDVWYDALITTYFGERFGVPLGAGFSALMRWLPQLHPYRSRQLLGEDAFYDQVYLATHLVYTHNDYGQLALDPSVLPQEHDFLLATFQQIIEDNDPETYAEFVDTLESLGHTAADEPAIGRALDGLMMAQNADGSWGALDVEDIYDRYHPTWTAVDALKAYAYRGTRSSADFSSISLSRHTARH